MNNVSRGGGSNDESKRESNHYSKLLATGSMMPKTIKISLHEEIKTVNKTNHLRGRILYIETKTASQ
jgi:hypothetical protein